MILDKDVSEEYFIQVIYDYLVSSYSFDKEIHPITKEDKEEYARTALELHKEYWDKCKREYQK
jgi:hypothetical protein